MNKSKFISNIKLFYVSLTLIERPSSFLNSWTNNFISNQDIGIFFLLIGEFSAPTI